MTAAPEFHRLTPGLFIWHAYDAKVKADLFSTGIGTSKGVYLVDPIAARDEHLQDVLSGSPGVGVIVTNANHARASADFAGRFRVPVYLHTAARGEVDAPNCHEIDGGSDALGELRVFAIEGAAPGELAIYRPAGAGTLVCGDAVINAGSYGFTLLPAKYCTDPKAMRKSLRTLLRLKFGRLLFAHGPPLMTNGRDRLAELLDAK